MGAFIHTGLLLEFYSETPEKCIYPFCPHFLIKCCVTFHIWTNNCRFKTANHKGSDAPTSDSENSVSPVAKVLSPTSSDVKKSAKLPQVAMTRMTEETFWANVKEGQKEAAKGSPNPNHLRHLLQVCLLYNSGVLINFIHETFRKLGSR